jgi:hypothetical protein
MWAPFYLIYLPSVENSPTSLFDWTLDLSPTKYLYFTMTAWKLRRSAHIWSPTVVHALLLDIPARVL